MATKRKADSSDASKKGTQKRKRALASMQSFLEQLGESDPAAAQAAANPSIVQAVTLCHERFLHVVAAELVAGAPEGKTRRVNARHVDAAMRELGMDEVLQEAIAAENRSRPKKDDSKKAAKGKRKKNYKTKQWTEEELQEQERLLASSKDRMQNG